MSQMIRALEIIHNLTTVPECLLIQQHAHKRELHLQRLQEMRNLDYRIHATDADTPTSTTGSTTSPPSAE